LAVLRQRAARRYTNEPVPGEQGEDEDMIPRPVVPAPNDAVAMAKPKAKGEHVNFWENLEKQVRSSSDCCFSLPLHGNDYPGHTIDILGCSFSCLGTH
jgi:hypothetical protein